MFTEHTRGLTIIKPKLRTSQKGTSTTIPALSVTYNDKK